MLTAIAQGAGPIPGYTMLERIGAGAYGEVWRAEAPGGLVKAVKFVYGDFNESRAMREFKALEQIKQLRHPFLLSLERFEVIDGRLIIVTELADMSLKDRFQACRDAGAIGIARPELLNHLRDAADALDFINDSHSLQHLDVKAENLLLIGGRLKLADFGLVQKLVKDDASMLDGMTPRYAAPELFKGQPSKFSDQFSLAVVYVELLTGEAPFEAKSPADCAVQHLIGAKPRLGLLSGADQVVVAQALSRTPEQRFPSCRAFVDALTFGATSTPAPIATSVPGGNPADHQATLGERSAQRDANGTSSRRPEPAARSASARSHNAPPGDEATLVLSGDAAARRQRADDESGAHVRRLPPIELETGPFAGRPTLFIGVGGAAGQTLVRLRRRLEERFIFPDRIPAWKMLLVDTDADALEERQGGGEVGAGCETLLLKMRTTQEYREGSPDLLRWLSRRWLYNIPRTPKTSGWRPLGRLALVDHGAEVMERLRSAIQAFVGPAALQTSAETVNADFSGKPLIVIVASLGGGTGSGMVLDLAYAVRRLLIELGVSDYTLRGLLLHATSGDRDAQDLARANAYACMTELAHFNRPGCGYPGEEALTIPAFPCMVPTFDETFVIHLGDGLSASGFQDRIERTSDYLYYSLATRAGQALDEARQRDVEIHSGSSGDVEIRTFGMFAVNNLRREEVDECVDKVCQIVAERWLGPLVATPSALVSARFAAANNADPDLQVRDLVERALGSGASEPFVQELTTALEERLAKGSTGLTLAGLNAELRELVATLRNVQNGSRRVHAEEPDAGAPQTPKAPLASIRSTVRSFLNERVLDISGDLTHDFPRMFLRRERRANDADDATDRALQGFCKQLRMTARASILQSLKQVDVSRLLVEMAGKSRATREPIRELLAAATPGLSTSEAAERLFVFAPAYADSAALGSSFNGDLKEDANVVLTDDERLALCYERGQIDLAKAAAALIDENGQYAEVASRLQTRSDLQWIPLKLSAK
jgi:serine/threonine protein kinase